MDHKLRQAANPSQSERVFPYYPLLLAIYPALFLLASNIGQVPLRAGLRPLLFSLLGAALLFGLLRFLLRSWSRAAFVTGLAALLFFSYGHIYGLLEARSLFGMVIGRHRYLAPLWLALLAGGVVWAVRRKPPADSINNILNIVCLLLVLMAAGQITYAEVRGNTRAQTNQPVDGSPALSTLPEGSNANLPDVYYVILDAYTRQDALQEDYQYDNSAFLNALRKMGFVIPDCSQSNYSYTALSISSALNMNYLENFSELIQQGDIDRDWVAYRDYIQHNPVRQNFTSLGYKMVAFETGFWWADVTNADLYVVGNNNPLEKLKRDRDVTDFEDLYLRTTLMDIIVEANTSLRQKLMPNMRTVEERRYETVRFVFNQLEQAPAIPGHKYVYAHIVAPHPPFVFSPTGEYRVTGRAAPGYPDEITYLNQRVLEVVGKILADSPTPPVIILQGDHGWDEHNRMKILNAYYLPPVAGGKPAPVDAHITPVNTFRMIFDRYFGGHYDSLPNMSYFSTADSVYRFTTIPPSCVGP